MLIPEPTAYALFIENLIFLVLATLVLVVGVKRYPDARPFPGPVKPWPLWFRIWFPIIWFVGGVIPLITLVGWGIIGGNTSVVLALTPYFVMFFLQIVSEQVVWKNFQSPIWVIVPCLYLPWRVWQCVRGLETLGPDSGLLVADITLWALLVLWILNIFVHFTGIPNSMRWNEPRANG